MLGFCLLCFFGYALDHEDSDNEEKECCRPHNKAAEYAAEADAKTAYDIGKSRDSRNDGGVGELSLYVIHVATLRTGRSKDRGVGDGRNMVSEYRAAKSSRYGHNGKCSASAENGNGDGNKHAEGSPRGTRREGDGTGQNEEDGREEERREVAVCQIVFHKGLCVKVAALCTHNAGNGPSKGKDQDTGTIALKPSVRLAVISLKETTRAII